MRNAMESMILKFKFKGGEVNMLVGVLNSKCCFGLNSCFSSNWSFNPIFFKTQSSWGDGIKSSWKACGKSGKDRFVNGAPLGGPNGHSGNGNGAPFGEKGGTCGQSGGSDMPNPAKGNDLSIREDSKNPKSKDPESNDSDYTHADVSDDSDYTHVDVSDDSDYTHVDVSGDSDYTHVDVSDDSDPKHSYPRCTPPHIAALWVLCEDCYQLNYRRFLKERNNMCEHCGYHFKMNSPERIEFLIDPDTWHPIDEDMASPDPDPSESECALEDLQKEISLIRKAIQKKISEDSFESDSKEVSEDPSESHSEEEDKPYEDRLYSYRKKTGLNEAVQTGVGQINGIPVAFGIMEFEFMGGSMGSVVGEKIARLVEYAINESLPLIIVCASGGARMQEGSVSLMQMAKISCALLDYDQSNSKLVYISILASPTTGGVTASFGTLADIILAEPNSYIAFAGKRVIEETLKQPIPEGSQEAEPLFEKGILDLIIPRNLLKHVLTEFLQFHGLNPLNSNSIK